MRYTIKYHDVNGNYVVTFNCEDAATHHISYLQSVGYIVDELYID